MEEENKIVVKPVIGVCEIDAGGYALPINENTVIERCALDIGYFNIRLTECERDGNAKIVVGLSQFFNTYERTQLFSINDPKDKQKKILIIRIDGNNAVVVFPDFECHMAKKATNNEYNSFVFSDKLKYKTTRDGESFTITLTKSKRFYGTIKEYFEQYGSCFDIGLGDLLMEMI